MKKIISVIILISVLSASINALPVNAQNLGTGVTVADTKLFTNAGMTGHAPNGETSKLIKEIKKGVSFTYSNTKLDADGELWYYVTIEDGSNQKGYLYSPKVKIDPIRKNDEDFEKNLLNFPKAYRDSLRKLHNTYPNWQFCAEPTNCTLEEALNNEYRPGKNLRPRKFVELSYKGEEWRDPRAKIDDNTWEDAESGRWTYASKMAIKYFMDPKNFLNDQDIFMFLCLSYDKKKNSKTILKNVIKNTFMDTDEYADIIMKAADKSGLSPIAIASLIIIEQGTKGTSDLISGKYKGYKGYYNFFNVGVYGTKDQIIKSGLEYAKKHNWDSIETSIIGGAKFAADGYFLSSQDTYYYMDYNVVTGKYDHQYSTSIYDAYNKGRRIASACTANKESSLEFIIPVFDETKQTKENKTDSSNTSSKPEKKKVKKVVIKYGDINRDGTIDVIDAASIRKHILSITALTVKNNPEADINKDGNIDVIDAAKLRKHILGIETIGG